MYQIAAKVGYRVAKDSATEIIPNGGNKTAFTLSVGYLLRSTKHGRILFYGGIKVAFEKMKSRLIVAAISTFAETLLGDVSVSFN